MSRQLSELEGCFEGVVPAVIATCSKDGVPNASYLSHVYKVDDKHIATSFQFFNKTRANLLENPYATVQIRHPANLYQYRIKAKYLRSEESGPLFDYMSVKLDVISAHEGMGAIFKLKAADVYEVLAIEEVEGKTNYHPSLNCPEANLHDLELMRVMSDKMNQARSLEELFDLSMQLLNSYMGWTHMILLLADEEQKTLLTHASFGYEKGGVGSEVKWGEGLIGLSAEYRRMFQVGAVQESLRYAKAVKESRAVEAAHAKIPLPGLANPASQIAAPICAHGEFWGVLVVESETSFYWENREMLFLSTLTNLLGLGLSSLEGKDRTIAPIQSPLRAAPKSDLVWRFRFVEDDDLIFVNDQYLIKNIPARILLYLLKTYQKTGRTEFSNMELRSEKSLMLPEGKDNLEARLILLRKRLEEQPSGVRLMSTGRGKFAIEVSGEAVIS